MSIEMLTTAARAAGFAMAPSDDLVSEPKRREAEVRANAATETTAVVQVTREAPQASVWSFWKTA